jgi:hypothetical protein
VELRPNHADCWIRQIVGGRRHLLLKCSCYGNGGPEDEIGRTRRQAATEARIIFEEMTAQVNGPGVIAAVPWPAKPLFRCPACGAVSHNPNDAREQYCGRCHRFVKDPQ